MSFDKGHKRCDAQMRRNAEFIANAPTDISFLLKRVAEAEGKVAEAKVEVWNEAIAVLLKEIERQAEFGMWPSIADFKSELEAAKDAVSSPK